MRGNVWGDLLRCPLARSREGGVTREKVVFGTEAAPLDPPDRARFA